MSLASKIIGILNGVFGLTAANSGGTITDTITGNLVVTGSISAGSGLATPPFSDATALVKNAADATKLIIVSAAGITTGTTRTLTAQDANYTIAGTTVALGGTGLTSGTSGGVLAFTASTTLASSGVLAANQLVLGGGAGVAPSTLGSLGTTSQILQGNASGAPSWTGSPVISTTLSVPLVTNLTSGGAGGAVATACLTTNGGSGTNCFLGYNNNSGFWSVVSAGTWCMTIGNVESLVYKPLIITSTTSYGPTLGNNTYLQLMPVGTVDNATICQFNGSGTGNKVAVFQGVASRTVAILQLQTSAGASLGNVGGSIFDHFAVGSSTSTDGTEDTLYTDTTAANTLAVNGDKIVVQGLCVQTVAHASATRRIRIYFAGTAIYDSTALATVAIETMVFSVTIIRDSSTSVRCAVSQVNDGVTAFLKTQYTAIGSLTLTSTNILKVTGVAAGAGAASADINARMEAILCLPNA